MKTSSFFFPPKEYNIWALVYEDNEGNGLPEHIGGWAKAISDIIKRNDSDANLLVHIHERFGFCQSSVMQVGDANLLVHIHTRFGFCKSSVMQVSDAYPLHERFGFCHSSMMQLSV